MKCRGKKIVSVLLVLVMVISLLPDIFVVGADASTSEDWEYSYCGGYNIEIIRYNGDESSVTVPSEIDGRRVTEIGDSAFENNTNLTNIVMPKSIVRIGDRAFSGCSSLLSVSIPNGVTNIGDSVFAFCMSLTSVTIPESVTSIKFVLIWGYSSFYLCCNLKSINVDSKNPVFSSENGVLYNKDKSGLLLYPEGKNSNSFTIPNGVEYFMAYAFSDCSKLTSITIPNSVKSIGRSTFSGCRGLAGIKIPNSVKSIGIDAFSGCTGLSSITIPNSVKSIGAGAFYNCSKLTEVKIPESVIEMGKETFYNCTNLKAAKFMGKKPNALAEGPWEKNPTFNRNIFQNTHKDFIIYYPKWYEKNWKDYKYYPKLPHYEGGTLVERIKINKRKLNIIKNKKYQLKQTVTPIKATNKVVTWISSNPKVATVSQKGIVKAKRKGKCKISAVTEDGDKRASCQVFVVLPVKKVKLNKKKITIEKGKKYSLKPKVMPQNATTKRVLWRSSNKKVATVSKKGVVKARKRGKCTVTVITKDGKKKAKCKVIVK